MRCLSMRFVVTTFAATSLLIAGCGDDDDIDFDVGQTGPAGGVIFFADDGGDYDFNYLEAAPKDAESEGDNSTIHLWASGYGDAFFIQANDSAIGSGEENTATIVAGLEDDEQSGRAAQVAADFEVGGYDDWFLPSRDELELMYEELHLQELGDFQDSNYWSSTEVGLERAMGQNFHSGLQTEWRKDFTYYVRPIRAF